MTPNGTSAPGGPGGYERLAPLMTLMTGDEKHEPAATSTMDALWVLYDKVLRLTPETLGDPARDRFLLSKGHGPMAYYAVLAAKGFLDPDLLAEWSTFDSPLGQHPDRALHPAFEIGSGSLGHGLPLGVGLALGLRARRLPSRVHVMVGDAELDEGSNHEALAYAGAIGLDSLHVVLVDNASSTHGWRGGAETRFTAEGWSAVRVDGRDHDRLEEALTAYRPGRPHAVIAQVEPKTPAGPSGRAGQEAR